MLAEPRHPTSSTRTRRSRSAVSPQPIPEGVRQELTVREGEVLALAGQGLSIKGIAQALGISSGTVTWHLKNCYQKYGVGCREQALRQARLQAQIRPVATSVCECGRVHALWGPGPVNAPDMNAPDHHNGLATSPQGERK
ncbi:response regulator transcription factor [Solimonas sp. SE-A11]|uniref:response regulator transcription factor n=1 Tax=Solimonas sp. SE-A11 TaxID=3054954 RepID=UPI00259C9A41|nr:helix-turn-helix transcriptional regulator [Solimonas sp. SE-A11]MDM4769884.1 helix-turn-helix transcriptional regulator [Solimonas sp. SE-A11]